jgi:DNA-binding SARP family transcriptional activator
MIRIKLIGAMSADVEGRSLSATELGGRPRQVLELLALEAGGPVAKERLADLLWEGHPPASSVGTLESYVSVLRRNMGLGSGRGSILATTPNGYRLDASAVTVDLQEFRALLAAATECKAAMAVDFIGRAVDMASGVLLADEPYAAWAIQAREVFTRELVSACVHAAQLSNALGDFPSAVRFARIATDNDRLCEDAWQHLMRAHWFSGLRAEALRAYHSFRAAMLDELGDEPGAQTQDLYFAILRDGPTERTETPTSGAEVRTLMLLLRQALDGMPGVQAPAQDSALGHVAVRALELAG